MRINFAPNSVAIFLTIVLAGIVCGIAYYLSFPNFFFYFGDSISNIVGARTIVDSEFPGLQNIGTVWLPLTKLIYLPTSLIDVLFYNGLSGIVVGLPMLGLSAVVVFKTGLKLGCDSNSAALVALLFGLNPAMLYLSMIAMTEVPFLMFFLLANNYLVCYLQSGERNLKHLLLVSIFLVLASLIRYEVWLSIICFITVMVFGRIIRVNKLSWVEVLLVVLSGSGIFIWMFWNYINYDDLLYFGRAELYSASWQAENLNLNLNLKYNIFGILSIILTTIKELFTEVFLLLAIVGLYFTLRIPDKNNLLLILSFNLSLIIAILINMFLGVAVMDVWLNSRYGLQLFPFIIIVSFIFFRAEIKYKIMRKIFVVVIFFYYIIIFLYPTNLNVVFQDGKGGFYYEKTDETIGISDELLRDYKAGRILMLTGAGQMHRIAVRSGVSLKNFIVGYNSLEDLDLMFVENRNVKYVITSAEPDLDGLRWSEYWLANREEKFDSYELRYENEKYKMYRKRK